MTHIDGLAGGQRQKLACSTSATLTSPSSGGNRVHHGVRGDIAQHSVHGGQQLQEVAPAFESRGVLPRLHRLLHLRLLQGRGSMSTRQLINVKGRMFVQALTLSTSWCASRTSDTTRNKQILDKKRGAVYLQLGNLHVPLLLLLLLSPQLLLAFLI